MGNTFRKTTNTAAISQILDFWYLGSRDGVATKEQYARWYGSSKAFDSEIREKFLTNWEDARDQKLNNWKEDRDGRLALIILVDQLARNMHRGSSEAFLLDPLAEEVCVMDCDMKVDTDRPMLERYFLYMPLMHSEDLKKQEMGLEKFKSLAENDPEQSTGYKWSLQHLEVIKKFGRFPHRNKVLGRESTKEEEEWLANLDEVPVWAGGKKMP